MAFSTELVLAAQTGPSVEVVSTAVATTNTNSFTTSLTLPVGEWMVVVKCRTDASYVTAPGTISIDGGQVFRMAGDTAAITRPTGMRDAVTGGRSITIAFSYIKNRVFDIYGVRTG